MNIQTLCQACFNPIQQPTKGRKAKYCGDACKQAAYRLRTSRFERVRFSKRTQSGFLPVAPANGRAFRLLPLRNETSIRNVYKQTDFVDLVGLL